MNECGIRWEEETRPIRVTTNDGREGAGTKLENERVGLVTFAVGRSAWRWGAAFAMLLALLLLESKL